MPRSLRIFHTADVHLGMKFSSYSELHAELAEARFKTLEAMVRQAGQARCQLLVVGGDLFDRVTVPKRDITRAAQILRAFEGALVAVLPGNHDYYEDREDALWPVFREAAGDKVLLLTEMRPYDLAPYDLEGVRLYPAPCRDKHSARNTMEWIRGTAKDPSFTHHIGVAHGSLDGLSYDREGQYYPMTRQELLDAGVDFWLMGHIHVRHPETPDPEARIFYPGTPEPDGFDCSHGGTAWVIESQGNQGKTVEPVHTGHFRFDHRELQMSSLDDLRSVREVYERSPEAKRTLLKLQLKGRLDRESFADLGATLHELQSQLLHLKTYTGTLGIRITQADIDREFTKNSFPYRLLQELAKNEEDPEALQIAYDLIQRSGQRTGGGAR